MCEVPRNHEFRIQVQDNRHYFSEEDSEMPPLLLVCRVVHDEVEAIVYSENLFILPEGDVGNFGVLRTLRPRILGLMKRLHVELSFVHCTDAPACRHRYGTSQDPPLLLDCKSRRNVDLYHEWKYTMQYLASCTVPGRLEFGIRCYVGSTEAARLCLEALLCMPKLADCFIKLPHTSSTATLGVARSVAFQLTGRSTELPKFSRFLELPTELQLNILEYTDLVTPLREVEYQAMSGSVPYGKYRNHYSADYCTEGDISEYRYGGCHPKFHHACKYRLTRHTFCRLEGVATAKCICWEPPTSLFLISKGLRNLVNEVFFTRNRFVFPPQIEYITPEYLPVSCYISRMSGRLTLHWLRDIQILLPAFQEDYCGLQGSKLTEWAEALEAAKDQLDLSQLKISLYLSVLGIAYVPSTLEETQIEFMKACYWPFLLALSSLKGLKAFHVYLITHYRWTRHNFGSHFPRTERDELRKGARHVEKEMEQYVMGKDYNSGISKVRDFRWPQCLRRNFHCRNCQYPS